MTRKEIEKLLELMLDTYPNTKIRNAENTVSTWLSIFKDYDTESVIKAAKLYMEEGSFFPSPAEVKKRIHRANIIYGRNDTALQIDAPVKQIEASTQPYIDERVEYIMEHFCEGGDCGWDGVNYANT